MPEMAGQRDEGRGMLTICFDVLTAADVEWPVVMVTFEWLHN